MNQFKRLLGSCFGLGWMPVAPGTFGTLGGVLIAWALAGAHAYPLWILAAIGGLYLVGRDLGDFAERDSSGKDPQWFVLDEVIGYLVAVLWIRGPSLLTLLVAFVLFRLFDIWKPWPAKLLEKRRGGDGILLDDVAAGVWALLVLAVLRFTLLDDAAWSAR